MNKTDYSSFLAMPRVAFIAPAGHGKTEAIGDMVLQTHGRQLILTHTNAGVLALQKRLRRKGIDSKRYSIQTIAAFCMNWCFAYPATAGIDITITPQSDQTRYYHQLYRGAAKVFSTKWAQSVLQASYSGLFVDEYQDCTIEQHAVVMAMLPCFPVRIFGDPLQGIFSWAGTLVDMENIGFPIKEPLQYPWRWDKTNPELGIWIKDIRVALLPVLKGQSVTLNLANTPDYVQVISSANANMAIYKIISRTSFKSVVYLTKYPKQQENFAQKTGGMFTYDETQECKDLYEFAKNMDSLSAHFRALKIIEFSSKCATHIGQELNSYYRNLKNGNINFPHIRKYCKAGQILSEICKLDTNCSKPLLDWFEWLEHTKIFKIYRKELLSEAKRCIKYAAENSVSYEKAALLLRNSPHLRGKYDNFKYLSSRPVLSKGLEFDCVIIDLKSAMDAKDFYVAISRATRNIILITDNKILSFSP